MVKLFCFDMDGTVLDSMPALRQLGIDIISTQWGVSPETAQDFYDKTVGHPFSRQVEILFPGQQNASKRNAAVINYVAEHSKMASDFQVPVTVYKLFEMLGRTKLKTALVSSTSTNIVCRSLRQLAPLGFNSISGWGEGRDKETQIRKVLDMFAVTKEETVLFGDSKSDAEVAETIGCAFHPVTVHTLAEIFVREYTWVTGQRSLSL